MMVIYHIEILSIMEISGYPFTTTLYGSGKQNLNETLQLDARPGGSGNRSLQPSTRAVICRGLFRWNLPFFSW